MSGTDVLCCSEQTEVRCAILSLFLKIKTGFLLGFGPSKLLEIRSVVNGFMMCPASFANAGFREKCGNADRGFHSVDALPNPIGFLPLVCTRPRTMFDQRLSCMHIDPSD